MISVSIHLTYIYRAILIANTIGYPEDTVYDWRFAVGIADGLPSPKMPGSSPEAVTLAQTTPNTTYYPEPYFIIPHDTLPLDDSKTSSQRNTSSESSDYCSSIERVQKLSIPARGVDGERASSYKSVDPEIKQEHSTAHRSEKERPSYRKRTRTAHNVIEQRYRDNLNTQIERLRLVLSESSWESTVRCTTGTYSSDSTSRYAPKAVVIETAASYIREVAAKSKEVFLSNESLQARVNVLEKEKNSQRIWIEQSSLLYQVV